MSGGREECWKQIAGYEGLYEVSNTGKVRRNGVELKPAVASHGYYMVNLSKDGKEKSYTIHRLVAEAFISNPEGLPCVNHKDEQKLNNDVSNLEWCTVCYNNRYGTKSRRIREKLSKPIVATVVATGEKEIWESAETASKALGGYSNSNIYYALKGKRKTVFKRTWEYL
nr:HNH endonuclease [Clostridia bacterium]